jgi:hypothetical protein
VKKLNPNDHPDVEGCAIPLLANAICGARKVGSVGIWGDGAPDLGSKCVAHWPRPSIGSVGTSRQTRRATALVTRNAHRRVTANGRLLENRVISDDWLLDLKRVVVRSLVLLMGR